MSNFIQNDLFIFSVTTVALLLLAIGYILYQKIMYDKFIKELTIKHGFDKPHETAHAQTGTDNSQSKPDKPKEWFLNTEYHSYQTLKNLPSVGSPETIYYVREKGLHYIWSEQNYDYRSLWFHVKDLVETSQDLTIEFTDGTTRSYSVIDPLSKNFAYAKFMKWYLCQDTEYFNFKIRNGFDIIHRSKIKIVNYRFK